jgi:hypothetical protein
MKSPHDRVNTDTLKDVFPDIPVNLLDANLVYLYESGLLQGEMVMGRRTPIATRITPQGINVVENPSLATRFQLNVQILRVETVYGQVAQTGPGSTVIQTQTVTFDDLRRMVSERTDITSDEKQEIEKILRSLEKDAQENNLTKKAMNDAMKALAKYGWLIPPLTEVLKHAFGFH